MASSSRLPGPSLRVPLHPLLGQVPLLLPVRGLRAPLRVSLHRRPGPLRLLRGATPLLPHHLALLRLRRSAGCVLRHAPRPRRERRPRSWRARLPGAEPGSTCDPWRAYAHFYAYGAPGLGEHTCRGPP